MTRIPRMLVFALAIGAIAAGGCTRELSRGISPEGKLSGADAAVFPDPLQATLKDGTFPNVDNLRAIGPGVTRDQLYQSLGRPHFREGFKAREWDYLFHFRQDDGSVRTCQYKVIFDHDYRGQDFFWSPADCASVLAQSAPVMAAAAVAPAPVQQHRTLSADALFPFAKSGVGDISPRGRDEIAALAAEIKSGSANGRVSVVGYTDRIGGESANLALSQRRADSVRALLVHDGVAADAVVSEGRGESAPVSDCPEQPRQALIACLAPDRRVEVSFDGQ